MREKLITGKNRSQFISWYSKKTKSDFNIVYLAYSDNDSKMLNMDNLIILFECSPHEMQVGVLVDYYESIDANEIEHNEDEFIKTTKDLTVIQSMISSCIIMDKNINKHLDKKQ